MNKRTPVFFFIWCVIICSVFAGGRGDNQSHEARDPSGFTEFINIENLPPGTWNIYLEARDRGGNVTIAGPHNIFIDPASDLPRAQVINPQPNMHVQGNLNIVGTSTDDDGVAFTMLRITRGSGGRGELVREIRAEGTDFWSYLLDTSDTRIWRDGVYTLTSWAVDINGLSGISEQFPERVRRQHQVLWNLDRQRPEITVTSHELGAITSGRVTIRGTVWDGNGIESLSYSVDGGIRFRPVRIRYDRRENIYNFNFTIDTRNFEDGPELILLRARDRMGTEGALSFLTFVNNTGPEVGIVYPEPDEAVNGIFTVAGYAIHNVGLASLSWSLGRESGDIDLIKGNPWWAKEFDIRGQNVRNLDLTITATDLSGNRTVVRRRLPVDQEADSPTVALSYPRAGELISAAGMRLAGLATDNDGVASVFYSLNGGPPVEIISSGHFQLVVPGIPAGVHNLEVWAKDITGIIGPRTLVRGVIAPGAMPELAIDRVLTTVGRNITEERNFHSGMEISSESGDMLRLVIYSGSALQSVSYRFGSSQPTVIPVRGSRGGEFTQNIPVPADIDFGMVRLEITAVDVHGRGEPFVEYVFISDFTVPRIIDGHVPVNRLRSGPAALSGLNGLPSWPGEVRVPRGTRIPLTASIDPSIAQGARAAITLRSVIGGQERPPINASVNREGVISALLPADLHPDLYQVSLTVTPRNAEPLTPAIGEFWLLRPVDGRQVNTREGFNWVRPTGTGDGRILLSDGETIVGLYVGRPLQSVEIYRNSEYYVYEENALPFRTALDAHGRVNLSGLADGNFNLRLKLTDRDGRTFITPEYRFLVSSGNPELEIVESPNGQWLRDEIPVQFRVGSRIEIASVDFSTNLGTTWRPLLNQEEIADLEYDYIIERILDVSAIADGAIPIDIRVRDEAGRQTIRSFIVHKDTAAPLARLIVPVSGARVNGRIRMGIAISEAGRLASIFYENPGLYIASGYEYIDDGYSVTAVYREAVYRPAISRQLYPDPSRGDLPLRFLYIELDETMPLFEDMSFVFTDMAGNTSVLSGWEFIIDEEMDLPVVHISLPLENEVITYDFVVSGVCFDDDGVSRIFWRLNDEEYNVLEATHGFSIPISISRLTDNEHSITIFAEDIYGVRGLPVTRNFKVSLEEPRAYVVTPALGEILGGIVRINGVASDENGIARVQVSLDNGNSFNNAYGNEEWEYTFNSKILPNGANVVFIRVFDEYGIQAVYASMLVIDNTPPELVIETPLDGLHTTGPVSVTGQALDDQLLQSIVIRVSSLEGIEIDPETAERYARLDSIILEELDLSHLPDGSYNVEVWATDRAQNVTRISRNIIIEREMQRNFVEILYPLDGEFVQGYFNLYGHTGGSDRALEVTLMINGRTIRNEQVTDAGYYRFSLSAQDLTPGSNAIVVRSRFSNGETVETYERVIEYRPYGPWVTVETVNMGDFVFDRPWIMGRAGYSLSAVDMAILDDRGADREARDAARARALSVVELSFDNGRTFFRADRGRGEFDWRHRLETQDMREGTHYLIARATMLNGETAVTRLMFQIDNTPPVIRLISPQPGGRYNTNLEFTALASDDIELSSLTFHLRRGDWASYEVPGFIRGLYVEGTIPPFVRMISNNAPMLFAGGATFFDIGLGLSFFDDNVKLQFNYGQMTQRQFRMLGGDTDRGLRYGGQVLGFKILANVYSLPFSSIAGPDWNWLSASVALGANFSFFDVGRQGYTQSGNPTWLSAMIAQVEFPRVTLPNRTFLRTFSLFTEAQLWFVPTDVDAAALNVSTVIPSFIMGFRMYIF